MQIWRRRKVAGPNKMSKKSRKRPKVTQNHRKIPKREYKKSNVLRNVVSSSVGTQDIREYVHLPEQIGGTGISGNSSVPFLQRKKSPIFRFSLLFNLLQACEVKWGQSIRWCSLISFFSAQGAGSSLRSAQETLLVVR